MEVKAHPGVKNWLASNRSLGDRVEHGRVVADLLEHPGWTVLLDVAGEVAESGERNLVTIAAKTALSVDLQERIEFARKTGVQQGLTFIAEVAQSVLDSAKTAAAELKNDADLETSAAGGAN